MPSDEQMMWSGVFAGSIILALILVLVGSVLAFVFLKWFIAILIVAPVWTAVCWVINKYVF